MNFKNIKSMWIENKTQLLQWIYLSLSTILGGYSYHFWVIAYQSKEIIVLLATILTTLLSATMILLFQSSERVSSLKIQLNEIQKEPNYVPLFGLLWLYKHERYTAFCPACKTHVSIIVNYQIDGKRDEFYCSYCKTTSIMEQQYETLLDIFANFKIT